MQNHFFMNFLNFILLSFGFLFLANCKAPQGSITSEISINEGIAGRVLWREGNFMPTIDGGDQGKSIGISREILIFELTNINQVTQRDEFFTDIKSRLIKSVTSNPDGIFEVAIEPGTYSVFTKEEGGLFANIYDGENNIFPVTVDSGKVTGVTIVIDYKAAY